MEHEAILGTIADDGDEWQYIFAITGPPELYTAENLGRRYRVTIEEIPLEEV